MIKPMITFVPANGRAQPIETMRVQVSKEYLEHGRRGVLYGTFDPGFQQWAVVLWDDEEDPDLVKLAALEPEIV